MHSLRESVGLVYNLGSWSMLGNAIIHVNFKSRPQVAVTERLDIRRVDEAPHGDHSLRSQLNDGNATSVFREPLCRLFLVLPCPKAQLLSLSPPSVAT